MGRPRVFRTPEELAERNRRYGQKWRANNKEQWLRICREQYRKDNKKAMAAMMRWREKNLEHYRTYQREYRKARRDNDPEFRKRTNRLSCECTAAKNKREKKLV